MNSTPTENSYQVGGTHYQSAAQHWDFVWYNNLDYFQGQITKYVARWSSKGGLQDLYKARHFLNKYIALLEERQKAEAEKAASEPGRGYVNQG